MSELRVGAVIKSESAELGKVDALVIDPTDNSVTHLVVRHDPLGPRVLVPRDRVVSTGPDAVVVSLDEDSLHNCELFDAPQFNVPGSDWLPHEGEYEPGSYFLEPFATPLDAYVLAEMERVPKGEITIRRHDEVFSSDGTKVGHVDEFLVDPADGHVTHVVLREGHGLHHEDVVVPIGGATFEEGRVVLGIDLTKVHALEHIRVKRHGHVHQGDLD